MRRRGIGGSDIGAIVGLSPFHGAMDVYLEKIGLKEPSEESRRTRLGRNIEPALLVEYQEETMSAAATNQETHQHPSESWAFATPDALVLGARRGVELKWSGIRQAHRWGEPPDGHIPDEYLAQAAWYMWVLDYPAWDVAALVGDRDFRVFRLARNRDFEAALVEAGRRFWFANVVERNPPSLDGTAATEQYIKSKWPADRAPLRPAVDEEMELFRRLRDAAIAVKTAELEEAKIKAQLQDRIGDAEGLDCGPLGRVTWRKTKDGEKTNWEAVAREAGASQEIIDMFTAPKPGVRRFVPTYREV